MKCLSPYFQMQGSVPIGFPCGHCLVCRRKKAQEWALRLVFEAMDYVNLAFVTLTYSPQNVPADFSLVPSDLSSFVKRLRRNLERSGFVEPIRYYGCGEYGDLRKRPHYHLLIFGLPRSAFPQVAKSWKLGLIDIQVPRTQNQVASYVSSYVTKKQRPLFYGERVPPFNRQSKGLGLNYVLRFPHFSPVVKYGNTLRYIGRYLRNKLAEKFGILEQVKQQGLNALKCFFADFLDPLIVSPPSFAEYRSNPIAFLKKEWQNYTRGDYELMLSRSKLILRRDL